MSERENKNKLVYLDMVLGSFVSLKGKDDYLFNNTEKNENMLQT